MNERRETEVEKDDSSIFKVTKPDQYRTVNELFENSKSGSTYYSLLVLSAVIIASGLLLNNNAIVIGGMLVTPVLTPILTVSLGLAVGKVRPVRDALQLLIQSFLLVVTISFILALFLGTETQTQFVINNSLRSALLYFFVAFASGVAATLAWIRKEMAVALPGIAIAVTLVPPLALVGIWLSVPDLLKVRFFLFLFVFNFIGIMMGSIIVFSYLKFYKIEEHLEKIDQKQNEAETGKNGNISNI